MLRQGVPGMNTNPSVGLREAPACGRRAEEIQERGGKFRLLSRLLAVPPDAALLEDVRALGWIEPSEVSDLENLQVEFTRLFSAPGPDAVAAYQSIYTDVLRMQASGPDTNGCIAAFPGGEFRGYLGGESCSQVRHCYKAAGFAPQDPAPAMADHISTQLAFLAHLHLAQAQALADGGSDEARAWGELRAEFYTRFLGRWVNAFGEKLASSKASRFYARLGRLLLTALDGETE
jgi:TorA maturation chaperone TorD